MKTYIGIDNGVSGAIGIVSTGVMSTWEPMPVRKELNYTKAKKYINRVDFGKLERLLSFNGGAMMVLIERPMVNPGRFQATISAVRCLEATLIVLERLALPYQYIDSKKWQKTQLPSGLAGDELKQASLDVGRRLWPSIEFPKGADADALLIARHGLAENL